MHMSSAPMMLWQLLLLAVLVLLCNDAVAAVVAGGACAAIVQPSSKGVEGDLDLSGHCRAMKARDHHGGWDEAGMIAVQWKS